MEHIFPFGPSIVRTAYYYSIHPRFGASRADILRLALVYIHGRNVSSVLKIPPELTRKTNKSAYLPMASAAASVPRGRVCETGSCWEELEVQSCSRCWYTSEGQYTISLTNPLSVHLAAEIAKRLVTHCDRPGRFWSCITKKNISHV